jgi:hypothetical protein
MILKATGRREADYKGSVTIKGKDPFSRRGIDLGN